MVNRLASLLPAGQIQLHLRATEKDEAIREVARLLTASPSMRDLERFEAQLLEREAMASTCLGQAVALPHARTDAVSDIVVAAGRSAAGIPFGAETVQLIFVIGTPRAMIGEYLLVVREIARLLKKPGARETMLHAENAEAFARVFRES